ncbi:MAG: family 16 glycoside hydrolase [Gemmataceae bacterium]
MRPALLAATAVLAAVVPAPAVQPDGTRDLFNGKDLTGFVNVNCAPGTFFVKDGEIVTTGNPTGFLRTDRHYENFELDFDWMHVEKKNMANSGLFVWGDPLPAVGTPYTRGIEVQVLINFAPKDGWATSHGDIFSIWGAKCTPDRVHPVNPKMERCLPSENRVKGGGEWNHYKVLANDGVIKLHVNGKEVSGVSKSSPRKGYLAFESEGAECHFKNVKIKELPSTNPKPEEVAQVWEGHVSLFTGLDLAGWKTETGAWKASGGVLRAAGKAPIATEKAFGKCELMFDWRVSAKAERPEVVVKSGGVTRTTPLPRGTKAGGWNRQGIRIENSQPGPIVFEPAEGLELMNVFVKELK